MNIIVLDYSTGTINKIHGIPDNYSDFEIESVLNQEFHLSNCSWMRINDYNIYHYNYRNNKLIYEGV